MINVPYPAMALNSHNVPGAEYTMTNTWKVAASETPQKICGWVAVVVGEFKMKYPGRRVLVIFNCHGFCPLPSRGGYGLAMGTGFRRGDIVQFEKMAPHVDEIWLIACRAAYIDNPGGDGDGNLFVSGIAKAAKALVKASTAPQEGAVWLPRYYIDDWEGTVLTYGPEGNVVNVEYN